MTAVKHTMSAEEQAAWAADIAAPLNTGPFFRDCKHCGTPFEVPSPAPYGRFHCSQNCRYFTRRQNVRPIPECANCGVQCNTRDAKFCGRRCMGLFFWKTKLAHRRTK